MPAVKKRKGWCSERLKLLGAKVTNARRVILDYLYTTREHPCAEDIYFAIHKKHPAIGITTI